MITAEDNKSESTSRRGSIEIIDLIYKALPVETYHPVSKIAEKTGLDWKTTKRYLELMLHVQRLQKGDFLKTIIPGNAQPIYGRKRKR